jgi:hypothetical protein
MTVVKMMAPAAAVTASSSSSQAIKFNLAAASSASASASSSSSASAAASSADPFESAAATAPLASRRASFAGAQDRRKTLMQLQAAATNGTNGGSSGNAPQ